jgi:hypothetical protein
MDNSPQGWQYPQMPGYPQGPATPGSAVQPPRPDAMRRAVTLMYAGAALGIIVGVVDGLTTHNATFYYSSASSNTTTVHDASSLVAGILEGIINAALWLWMAWKTGAGRTWARVLSSVFFGFACLQLIGALSSLADSAHPVLAFILTLVEWGVGLAALIQLWKRPSTEFFLSTKRARLAFGAAFSGYQPAGYGQPPQYGQPTGYGQPPQYGQPLQYGQPPQQPGETAGQEPDFNP